MDSIRELMPEIELPFESWDDFQSMSWVTSTHVTNFLMAVTFIAILIWRGTSKVKEVQRAKHKKTFLPAPGFPDIKSLDNFNVEEQQPLKLRNFKPKYFLTMVDASALEKLDPSELILMDNTYASRLKYRQEIIKKHADIAVGINDEARVGPAIKELYTWLLGTYLPLRYPTMFRLHKTSFEIGEVHMLENVTTKVLLPAEAKNVTTLLALLENLNRTLDEEFLILVPEDEADAKVGQSPKYKLEAYIVCSPSGFNTRSKLGKQLAEIHEPVPSYKDKIEGSMDRYFAKIQSGEYVRRSNWSVTTNPELFVLPGGEGNHLHQGDHADVLEHIDPEKTWLRCERQTLHRLPKSQALVFAFKTHMYPLTDIKAEGLGEDLAQAIDGLREGNAPGMHFYKRGVVWGEAVKKYLRS